MGWTITAFGVLSIVALEAALVLLCFGRAPLASVRAGGLRRLAFLVAGQLLFVCLFIFGAYTEMRWDLSRGVLALKNYEIPELEAAVLQGDPACSNGRTRPRRRRGPASAIPKLSKPGKPNCEPRCSMSSICPTSPRPSTCLIKSSKPTRWKGTSKELCSPSNPSTARTFPLFY
jgi:hypothetical protein